RRLSPGLGAALGPWAWMPRLGAGHGCRAWVLGMDAAPGCWARTPRPGPGHGRRARVLGTDAAPGSRAWMPRPGPGPRAAGVRPGSALRPQVSQGRLDPAREVVPLHRAPQGRTRQP